VAIISGSPYKDDGNKRLLLGLSSNANIEDFVWHRDKKDRIITVESGQGWQLQYNGELPIELVEGKTYFIPAMMYHRVIPGVDNLKIDIRES